MAEGVAAGRDASPPTGEGLVPGHAKPWTMAELQASRTLVKSPPELWAECSDAASLARHLGAFGEISITKLEPETAVAWEGQDVRGTVTLEPTGWGTRVSLTARTETPAQPATTMPSPALQTPVASGPAEGSRRMSRWLGRLWPTRKEPGVRLEIVERPEADAPADEPPRLGPGRGLLDAALDSLGTAHRRPFSHA